MNGKVKRDIELRFNRQSILSNIITYMDYDIKSDLTQFKRDFFKDLSLEEEVALYIKVFQPLVDKLYQNYLEKMKIISEAINA
jgi:pantothenate synthetase